MVPQLRTMSLLRDFTGTTNLSWWVINANSKITFDETEPDIYNQQTSKIPQNKLAES